MRKLACLAVVMLAAGALADVAGANNGRHHSRRTTGPSVTAIADASTSWAEFSSKVPDVCDALELESR
jgi:hypothetical protein